MSLLGLLSLVACSDTSAPVDTAVTETHPFCDLVTDGGSTISDAAGGNESAGDLVIRVITSESVDPHDPLYVAFKDYTLENIDMGGVASTGKTSGDGIVSVNNLGPGDWAFRATWSRGSAICEASATLPVVAATTLYGCPVMSCPD